MLMVLYSLIQMVTMLLLILANIFFAVFYSINLDTLIGIFSYQCRAAKLKVHGTTIKAPKIWSIFTGFYVRLLGLIITSRVVTSGLPLR